MSVLVTASIIQTSFLASRSKPDLVYEVEGHRSLPCAHLFGFEIAAVLATDVIHTRLKLPCDLIFLPVLLSLHLLDRMHAQVQKEQCRQKESNSEQEGKGEEKP